MTPALIHGDNVSCSRVGGCMRRESANLRRHGRELYDVLGELTTWEGPGADTARTAVTAAIQALESAAAQLDSAGAALQGYATDLAEGHELGRRAELRVREAGLLLDGTRVVEPWGPAGAAEAERRRAQLPLVQARVDVATTCVGRARGRLRREMELLVQPRPEAASSLVPARPPTRHPGRSGTAD